MAEPVSSIKGRLLDYAPNPVEPRMLWVADRYNNFVTMATFGTWTEATGTHHLIYKVQNRLWDRLWRPDRSESERAAREVFVEWFQGPSEQPGGLPPHYRAGGPRATRFDAHLPWVAREMNRVWKKYRKPWVKRFGMPVTLRGFSFPSWWYSQNESGPLPTLHQRVFERHMDSLRRETAHIRDSYRNIVEWATATGVDLHKFTAEEARIAADRWRSEQLREAMPQGEVVYTFPDGWTVQLLTTREQIEAEGEAMGHCVADYISYVEDGKSRIYSLRDPKGSPHVTMEWNIPRSHMAQHRGKGNAVPKREYIERTVKWRCQAEDLNTPGLRVVKRRVPPHGELVETMLRRYILEGPPPEPGAPPSFLGDILVFTYGLVNHRDFADLVGELEEEHALTHPDEEFDPAEAVAHHLRMRPGSIRFGAHLAPWAAFPIWRAGETVPDAGDEMVNHLYWANLTAAELGCSEDLDV